MTTPPAGADRAHPRTGADPTRSPGSDRDLVVESRPIVMARIGWACAAVVLVVFVITALVMRQHSAGAHFASSDRLGTVVVGIVLAGLFVMPTRPRLYADLSGVRMRSFLGGWRTVPWDLVVAVEFPRKVRFARLVLPGEETLALYAVQRLDAQHAVETMGQLRRLFAATRPGPATAAP